jgi:hypothetical protein
MSGQSSCTIGVIIMIIKPSLANKATKPKTRKKEDIVQSIEALSAVRGVKWNRNNLKDKTTIPNLESIEALLLG